MSKLKILVDLYDTLSNFVQEWIGRLNALYDRNVDYNNIAYWDIRPYFPGLADKDIFEPLNELGFWSQISVKNNAPLYLEKLSKEGHDINIVTATHYKSVREKVEWLLDNFPFLKWEQVIICSNKQVIDGDVLIDDAVHNLIGGSYEKILFDAPHNRLFDEESIGATRVKNWEEVYGAIKKIERGV